jgi:hypothetical protein
MHSPKWRDEGRRVTQRDYIQNTISRESSVTLPVWRLGSAVSNKAVETLPRAFRNAIEFLPTFFAHQNVADSGF